MIYKKILNIFIVLSALSVSTAYAWTCPNSSIGYINVGYVGSIHYDNSSYSPTFTLDGYPNNWMQLSPGYGINTDYGRVLFTMLLTAKSAGLQIKIECNYGTVNKLDLLDSNS
jgi:hypothetical protein